MTKSNNDESDLFELARLCTEANLILAIGRLNRSPSYIGAKASFVYRVHIYKEIDSDISTVIDVTHKTPQVCIKLAKDMMVLYDESR